MQINPVRNDKFPAGDRGRWAIPKSPLGVHLLFISTCCGSAHPWVVFYFQTLLEGARARPQRPHIAPPRDAVLSASSTSSHECACCNCHAQLRRDPSVQQQPVCPTAFGPQMQSSTLRVVPTSRRALCPRRRNIRPLAVAFAIPSKPINQAHPTRPANDCVRGARPGAVAPHDAVLADRLGNYYQRRGARVASDFLVRRQARWIARLCGAK